MENLSEHERIRLENHHSLCYKVGLGVTIGVFLLGALTAYSLTRSFYDGPSLDSPRDYISSMTSIPSR